MVTDFTASGGIRQPVTRRLAMHDAAADLKS
jgi:hypothetical protein